MNVAKLGEVCELRYGRALTGYEPERSEEFRYRVYGTNGPIGWCKEPLFDGQSLVIGRKGAYRGVHYSPDSGWVIDTAYHLNTTDPHVDLKWLYFKLLTLDINRLDSGSAIPSTKREDFYSLAIEIPSLDSQRKISGTLTAYDDLIENNRRRIQLLEESPRLLYREWFVHLRFPGHEHARVVDGVPEGWELVTVPQIIAINPPSKIEKGKEVWYVPMSCLSATGMTVNRKDFERRSVHTAVKFKNGDVLFARITPCLENGKTGFVYFLPPDEVACGSTEFIVLRGVRVSPYFAYCLARSYDFRENAIKSMIGSSGRQRVQVSCFEEYAVALPPKVLLDQFDDIAENAFKQIRILAEQNEKLEQARDLLLPRLMSGKLPV